MKKILITTVAILSLATLGGCDIEIQSYSPENPPPEALQFSRQDIARYCGFSMRKLKKVRKPYSDGFECVKMYADQGHETAMIIVGKAYARVGKAYKSRYYLSLARKPRDDF